MKNEEKYYVYVIGLKPSFVNNKAAKKLAELLTIKEENIKIDKNIVWDFSIIIGKDYKNLKSFEQIQKFYSLF